MILIWFIVGIILAIVIARLNYSNKLFWIAFTSFAIGIAGGCIYNSMQNPKEDEDTVKVESTQVSKVTSSTVLLADRIPETPTCHGAKTCESTKPKTETPSLPKGNVESTTKPPTNAKE